jgi:DHA1 family bicyclomycin/chloramphenicol resistance-like MFS transporter
MAMEGELFPVRETAKIISLLILIPGVSPRPAPKVGGWVAVRPGRSWVFILPALA